MLCFKHNLLTYTLMDALEYLRQFRVGSYALFDILLALVGMYILSPLLSKILKKIGIDFPKKNWVILALPIGIVAHLLVGSKTQMTKDFLNTNGYYLLKVIIILLTLLGFKGIKRTKK